MLWQLILDLFFLGPSFSASSFGMTISFTFRSCSSFSPSSTLASLLAPFCPACCSHTAEPQLCRGLLGPNPPRCVQGSAWGHQLTGEDVPSAGPAVACSAYTEDQPKMHQIHIQGSAQAPLWPGCISGLSPVVLQDDKPSGLAPMSVLAFSSFSLPALCTGSAFCRKLRKFWGEEMG